MIATSDTDGPASRPTASADSSADAASSAERGTESPLDLQSLVQELKSLQAAAGAVPLRLKRLATIKVMRKKAGFKRTAILAGAGMAGAVLGLFTIASLIVLVLVGLSAGLAHVLGLAWWGGALLTGAGALVASVFLGVIAWRRFAAAQRRAIAQKLEAAGLSHYRPATGTALKSPNPTP